MKFLIQAATIHQAESSFHLQPQDLLIENGIIIQIGKDIVAEDAVLIQEENLHVSLGWADLKAHFCDPGEEHKETIESGLQAAAWGGFTHVASVASTQPVVDGKTAIEYAKRKAEFQVCDLHPMGAITEKMKGENLAEMYDMHQYGVRWFSDDMNSLSSGILYRALLYSKNFGGTVCAYSHDDNISYKAQVNEGEASTRTGLKADSVVAEWIDLERNIRLLEYTGGKLHVTGISSEESVHLIRKAKRKGLNISADVHAEQLIFNEKAVLDFDINFKLKPVLRKESDRQALWEGLKDGTIDGIASNHRPHDSEEKEVEFDYASFGNITLQTVFSSLHQVSEFDLELVLSILSKRNRSLLQIENPTIEVGQKADLTLFVPSKKWTLTTDLLISSTRNTPFLNQELTGWVVGIINNGKLALKERVH